MKLHILFLITLFVATAFSSISAQDSTAKDTTQDEDVLVFTFGLKQDIFPAGWRLVKSALKQAEEMDADYILIELDTYGGLVNIADSMRKRFLRTKVPILVFINNNAASAGALISIACDSIYMAPGSSIGAATVVNQSGEKMPDKYQSYMRSMMRSTAEVNGRDPNIAQAMVDESIEIEGIIEKDKILTFTTSEAIKHGYCEGEATTISGVLELANIHNYTLAHYEQAPLDNVISFLLNPVLSGILLMIIIGGIYFELQTPGVGFPGAASLTAAILYFAPLYLDGLAANWEIAMFVVGIVLVILEVFVIPGFGLAGIAGIMMIFSSLLFSLIMNDFFDFRFVPNTSIVFAIFRVLTPLILIIVILVFSGRSLIRSHAFQRLVLKQTQKATEGYTVHLENAPVVGMKGTVIGDLRPSGTVSIEEKIYDATTDGDYISKGASVVVEEVKGSYLLVKPA